MTRIAGEDRGMTRDEAWQYVMKRAVGRWEYHINACLEQCDGNVKEAVALSRRTYDDRIWMNSWGEYGHDIGIDSGMASRDQGIRVWIGQRRFPDPPDFTISWEDVFRYVRDGHQQLSLF